MLFIILLSRFFTPAFFDGLSLEFECQQVSLSLQDSSQYSGWSYIIIITSGSSSSSSTSSFYIIIIYYYASHASLQKNKIKIKIIE